MGVRFQNPTQIRLAQDNHMIDALAPDRSDQPFSTFCQGAAGDVGLSRIPIARSLRVTTVP